jgi:magnesium chelatase family protein
MMDRIDLHVDVPSVGYEELRGVERGESSEEVRQRVCAARAIQRERLASRGMWCNAQMGAKEICEFCSVDNDGHKLLERVVDRLGMSARAYARILKVARTIADMCGAAAIDVGHLAEAVQYRKLDRRRIG